MAAKMKTGILIAAALFVTVLVCYTNENRKNSRNENKPSINDPFINDSVFEMVGGIDPPVITGGDPGTEGNTFGFEGGRILKINKEYHIFTTEMWGQPVWCKTRLAHWTSKDGISWKRETTLFESSGDFTGSDSHACLWSPMPTFDEVNNNWVLNYVCYRSKPNTPDKWYRNYDGSIALAVSAVIGKNGIGGPYIEKNIIMEPDSAEPKLGLMGVNSFYPYQADGKWYALYGSSSEWNGLAGSPSLLGPWKRISEAGVVSRHTENPIVSRLPDGRYVAFFDGCGFFQKFGYMVSADGIQWSDPIIIDLENHPDKWWGLTRTPLGLIDEGKGNYSLYFTAYNNNFYKIPGIWEAKSDSVFDSYYASVGMIRLKLVR